MAQPKLTKVVRSRIEAALLKEDMTIQELAVMFDVSPPTIYAHFPGGPRKYRLARWYAKKLGIPALQLIQDNPGNYEAFSAGMARYRRKA